MKIASPVTLSRMRQLRVKRPCILLVPPEGPLPTFRGIVGGLKIVAGGPGSGRHPGLTMFRGMSQAEYRELRRSGTLATNPHNPHNNLTTSLETAKHYASGLQHDDEPGVVIKLVVPEDA